MDELNPEDPNFPGDTAEVPGAAAGEAQFFPAPPPPPETATFNAPGSESPLADSPLSSSPAPEAASFANPVVDAPTIDAGSASAQSAATQPAGWYPAPGGQRYWDGAQWTEHTAPSETGYAAVAPASGGADERQMAMFAHLGQLLGLISGIGGFLVPLVLMLTKGNDSPFVRRAAVESLNFWITGILAMVVSFVLLLVLVGFVLIPIVAIIWFVLPIYAGIKANEGIDYRYPFNLRLIS